jgi:hypothetical protein
MPRYQYSSFGSTTKLDLASQSPHQIKNCEMKVIFKHSLITDDNLHNRSKLATRRFQEVLLPPKPSALKKWVHSILAPNPLLLRRMEKPLSGLILLNPGKRFKHNRGQRPLPIKAFYIRIQIIFDISNFRHFSSFSSGNSGIPLPL